MSRLFKSFFMGGFECSTHNLADGRRLDLIESTGHDKHAAEDYRRLKSVGMHTARESLRWHLIEKAHGEYDFSSFDCLLDAARDEEMEIIWDLLHFGWPDDIDIFSGEFIDRFSALARAFARHYRNKSDEPLFVAPINEISFLSWAGGDMAYINPYVKKRGNELKNQLVRAAIAATEAVWDVIPKARIVQVDPIIHIVPNPRRKNSEQEARAYNEVQYAAWDMLAGRLNPELGGKPEYLDIIGVNYYPRNQWFDHGKTVKLGHPDYRHFSDMLREICERYGRPVFVSETGTEDDDRPEWFRYIAEEVLQALKAGLPIEGICLYPIVNHPGWLDNRHCHNGLWDYLDSTGDRPIYKPLAAELARQVEKFRDWQQTAGCPASP